MGAQRWCERISVFDGEIMPFCLAADGFRACAVEDLAADGAFGLLGTEGSCSQSVSSDRLVTADRSFDLRTPAIAGRHFPLHPTHSLDRRDMTVSLSGKTGIRLFHRVGSRWNDDGSIGAVLPDGFVGRVAVIGNAPQFGAQCHERALLRSIPQAMFPQRSSSRPKSHMWNGPLGKIFPRAFPK